MSHQGPPRRPFPGETEEDPAACEYWETVRWYSERVEVVALCDAESAIGDDQLPAARWYLDRVEATAMAEMKSVVMEGYKDVVFPRIEESHWYVDLVMEEDEVAKDSSSYEVTSIPRKPTK